MSMTTPRFMPPLGLGTWHMGERTGERGGNAKSEVAAIRRAIELGYRLFDTAEMYGSGGAETVLGDAIDAAVRAGDVKREDLIVVSKVLPSNADTKGVVAACERSRARMKLDALDLYLLHWRGGVPLANTLRGFEALLQRGSIRRWGVSNFDAGDMRELEALGDVAGQRCTANQVWYSLGQRGPGFELLPWMQPRGIELMAYCPLDEGRLAAHRGLQEFARAKGATASQIALAWLAAQSGVAAIPKSSNLERLRENLGSRDVQLTADDLAQLDKLFPPPRKASGLAMV
jgi:diketogulonate reductase-like aldo/keto reductase